METQNNELLLLSEKLKKLEELQNLVDKKRDSYCKASKKWYNKKYTITEDMTEEQKEEIKRNIEERKQKYRKKYSENKEYYKNKNKEYREHKKQINV
jgi:hypothetical protein